MAELAVDYGIKKALEQLGIQDVNQGTSTGSEWFGEGSLIESHSPVILLTSED